MFLSTICLAVYGCYHDASSAIYYGIQCDTIDRYYRYNRDNVDNIDKKQVATGTCIKLYCSYN